MLDSAITFLPTLELEKTREFYEGILGLELALDQDSCLIFRVTGAAYWGFCKSMEPLKEPQSIILTLVTDEVELCYQQLTLKRVKCDGPPRESPKFQIFHFFASDPNGYRLEIQRFLDPRWKKVAFES